MKDLLDGRDLLDFTPPPRKGPARSPRGWLIVHSIAWGFLTVVLVFVMPRFEAIFVDFGVDLPRFTVLLIKVSHLGIVLVPSVLALLAADWSILKALDRRGESGGHRAWSILMLAVPALLIGATIVALASSLLAITTRLSG